MMKRKLISKKEDKISWLQIVGFALIMLGILYLVIKLTVDVFNPGNKNTEASFNPEEISIIFFVIMLGFALAFPDLLMDHNNGLSTMRLVVFMVVNVICILMLKIGWDKQDFDAIKINEYWVGIIAFIFGAKAVQSFFESRMATKSKEAENADSNTNNSALTGRQNAQLAINQNKEKLLTAHPNIKLIMPSYCVNNGARTPCVDIGITDNNKQSIPPVLNYKNADDTDAQIKTRIISNFGNAKPQTGRGEFISNENSKTFLGTVACLVKNNLDEIFALTCNHVLTNGDFADPGNLGDNVVEFAFGNFRNIGTWQQGKMDNETDAALVSIDNPLQTFPNDVSTDIYTVTEDDCSLTEVELVGAISNTQRAFIIHTDQSIPVDYNNKTIEMDNLVSISATTNHLNFTAPTQHADSGALVYHAQTRRTIGMIIGANEQFSFIIPMKTVLKSFNGIPLTIA